MASVSLFDFATSELSQDAFICWLLTCADPSKDVEPNLHDNGQLLVKKLFEAAGIEPSGDLTSIEVKKQYHNIDILVIVNDGSHVLIIEDKVNTGAHSGQLKRYAEQIENDFPTAIVGRIYFKTGNQSNFKEVEDQGFSIFTREMFLGILNEGARAGIQNDIYMDYSNYLNRIQESIDAYKTKPLNEWDWQCWTGFFTDLQTNHLDDAEWDYVPNASGGFMGLWWHWRGNKYLQLEENKLCFRIGVEDKELQSEERNLWHDQIIGHSEKSALELSKPDRFGKGAYMTVAVLDGGSDYRKTKTDGTLDLAPTVAVLREAARLLDLAIEPFAKCETNTSQKEGGVETPPTQIPSMDSN